LKDEWIYDDGEQNNFFSFSTLIFVVVKIEWIDFVVANQSESFWGDVSSVCWRREQKRHVYKEAAVRGKER